MGRYNQMDNNGDDGLNNWDQPWPCAEILKTLAELNEQCLQLMKEQALLRTSPTPAIFRDLVDLWAQLDVTAIRRAAACPFLLMDAGFTDPYRWRWVSADGLGDSEPATYASSFTVVRATSVAHQIFTNAWYIARTQPMGAPVFLGMPVLCANLLRGCSTRQVTELANEHVDWLRPRWAGRTKIWQELLEAAIHGDSLELEMARMHGLRLLAYELRALELLGAKDGAAKSAAPVR